MRRSDFKGLASWRAGRGSAAHREAMGLIGFQQPATPNFPFDEQEALHPPGQRYAAGLVPDSPEPLRSLPAGPLNLICKRPGNPQN